MMRGEPHNYDEIALDYFACSCWQEATSLWNIAITEGAVTPMTYYYFWAGVWFKEFRNKTGVLLKAAEMCPDYCFPNRLENNPCITMCHGAKIRMMLKLPVFG